MDIPTLHRRLPAPIPEALPVAAAIGVFGVVYGAAAPGVIGPTLTVWSSVLIFSGAAQFSMLGLLAAGAVPAAVLGAVAVLALRHVPLGVLLRPRLPAKAVTRAGLSWFLIDETTGLALASRGSAGRTLLISGVMAYAAWVTGTVIGVAGGSVAPLEPIADALFPVLFVGLAGLTATTGCARVRAFMSGLLVLALLLVWPASGGIGAIAVAVGVCMVGRR